MFRFWGMLEREAWWVPDVGESLRAGELAVRVWRKLLAPWDRFVSGRACVGLSLVLAQWVHLSLTLLIVLCIQMQFWDNKQLIMENI